MWLINWLPVWVFYAIFVASGVLAVGASILNVRSAQLVALFISCAMCFHIGGIETQKQWQARVDELQQKAVIAEQKSAVINTQIETKIQTITKLVKEVTHADTVYITKYVAQDLDSECKLTNASVMLHNSASQNEVPTSTADSPGDTSTVKASELLTTVTENYGTYYEVVARLRAWQDWYYQQKKIFEE